MKEFSLSIGFECTREPYCFMCDSCFSGHCFCYICVFFLLHIMIHLNTAIRIKAEELCVILLVSTFTGAKMWIFCMSIIFYYVIANKNKNKPISLLKYALNAYVCFYSKTTGRIGIDTMEHTVEKSNSLKFNGKLFWSVLELAPIWV